MTHLWRILGCHDVGVQPGSAQEVRYRRGALRVPVGSRFQARLQEALPPQGKISKGKLNLLLC